MNALAFVVQEEETTIVTERTAQRSTELILAERWNRRIRIVKEVARVELVIPQKLEQRTVKFIRS